MHKILLLGAGRSSSSLIRYLLAQAQAENWQLTVCDQSKPLASSKTGKHARAVAIGMDITDAEERRKVIAQHDIVISLLPPALHSLAALDCLREKKDLLTASYVSDELQQMNEDVKKAGLLFMCEMGLDPGIDHMSAMKIIHDLKEKRVRLLSFSSATGGLVAPESDDNPWHYKVTWNPRNVILAGQGAAQYLENGKIKCIPYNRLFLQTEKIKIHGYGEFESYANRDSLSYIEKYGLEKVPDVLRSTIRRKGYCEAWNALVSIGLTDDSYVMHGLKGISYADWLRSFLPASKNKKQDVMKSLVSFLNAGKHSDVIKKIAWLGLLSDKKIMLMEATPAQVLQQIIEDKWVMKEKDRDMVVMQHRFVYEQNGKKKKLHSNLVVTGEDKTYTAMAKTVGLPIGILVKLILRKKIKTKGVKIPVMQEVYNPVLKELEEYGVKFVEK